MPDICHTDTLVCHSMTPAPEFKGIDAGVEFHAGGQVVFRYRLNGRIDRLRIPVQRLPLRADDLWEHTCCEAFVGIPETEAYREFNFSPSGQWATYDFSAYRQRIAENPRVDSPLIAVRHADGHFELTAFVTLASLPTGHDRGSWEIGLSVVLESFGENSSDSRFSYWALRHPSSRPDFHHRGGFVLRLEPDRAIEGQ